MARSRKTFSREGSGDDADAAFSPGLTPKQKEILDFIQGYSAERGYAPSQQEIASHFQFKSLGTVQNYLVRLERQGALRKSLNARRGMQVLPPSSTPREPTTGEMSGTVPLPLVGRVAAGRPIEAILSHQTVDVPASLLTRQGEHFALEVSGDSMIEDGILSGDTVVIRKQSDARNGQTVVALVNNEATIKRYYRREQVEPKGSRVNEPRGSRVNEPRGSRVKIELHPANPAYDPLIIESMVDPDSGSTTDFQIAGILVGLIRRVDS